MLDRSTMYKYYGQKDRNMLKYGYYAHSGRGRKGLPSFFYIFVPKFEFLTPKLISLDVRHYEIQIF